MMAAKFPSVDLRGAFAGQEVEPFDLAPLSPELAALLRTIGAGVGYAGPIVMWGLGGRHERHKDGSVTFTPFSEMTEEDMP